MVKVLRFKPLFPAIAPLLWLNAAFGFTLLMVVLSVWLAMHQPTIGVTLGYAVDAGAIRVLAVDANGPAGGKLKTGDIISALATAGQPIVNLSEMTLVEDPDCFATYAKYQAFFAHQRAIYATFIAPTFDLLLGNGQRITLHAQSLRPLATLPATFWGLLFLGNAGFLIGIAIWIFQRYSLETRLLAVAGFGFMLGASCLAIYASRELAFSPEQFRLLTILNYAGFDTFLYMLVLLLWYYPKRLFKRSLFWQTGLWIGLLQLNNFFQFLVIPGHAFALQGLIPFILCISGARLQWLNSRRDPLSGASLRWLLLAIFVPATIVVVIVCMTYLMQEFYIIPLWVSELLLFGIFIGLILGILKYRLFNIDYWWWLFWLWFLAGSLLVLIDITFAYLFQIYPLKSLSLAIIVTAWLYFPLRQWLMGFSKSQVVRKPDKFLTSILESLTLSPTSGLFDKQWEECIAEFFKPLSVERVPGSIPTIMLKQDGLKLLIPALSNRTYLELTGMELGGRLFGPNEVSLVQSTFDLARQSTEWHKTREQTARQEREWIVRDLHDDVGAALLSLVYTAQTEEQSKLAKHALSSLRETMHVLQDDRITPLSENLLAWQSEIQQRLDLAGVAIEWAIPAELPDKSLNCRQRINLDRIFREALSNILKHSQPKHIRFACFCEISQLQLMLDDDGQGGEPAVWKPHVGLFNMRKRADEINARLEWQSLSDSQAKFYGTRFTITIEI